MSKEIKIDMTPEEFNEKLKESGLVKNITPLTKEQQKEILKKMFSDK